MSRQTVVLLALLSVGGCAGTDAVAGPDQPAGAGSSRSSATGAPSVSPSASPTARTVALREVVETPRGSLITVRSLTPGRRSKAAPTGTEWASADVKFCVTKSLKSKTNITNITREFALSLQDGTMLQPERASALANERFSDDDLIVGAGDCVRGPVVFAVPNGSRPTSFVLVTQFGNLEWPLAG